MNNATVLDVMASTTTTVINPQYLIDHIKMTVPEVCNLEQKLNTFRIGEQNMTVMQVKTKGQLNEILISSLYPI